MAVYKVLKFDIDFKIDKKKKVQKDSDEIDYLSMTEIELLQIPIVEEMYESFSCFYNPRRCALAL